MLVIHSLEEYPTDFGEVASIFLVGPTPRDAATLSWRPEAIQLLESLGFDGYVFSPETRRDTELVIDEDTDSEILRERKWKDQCFWERAGLEVASVIAAWVPRELNKMPAFTTNIEFGRYVTSGRLLYGRPLSAPKTGYLDWLYELETKNKPANTIKELMENSVKSIKDA